MSSEATARDKTWRKAHGMSERAWAVYVDQRRRTADALAEVIHISVAEELRRQHDIYATRAASHGQWVARCTGAPEAQIAAALTAQRENAGVALELRRRADALDPEGAAK